MDTVKSTIARIQDKKAVKLSDSEVDILWEKFVLNKNCKEIRDKIIVNYIYLVKYVVGRLRINLPPSISTEDIAGYGVEGLIDAIERFIPSRGVRFETYALLRMRGSIIDRIRSQDWVPRGTQRRFKKIQNTILSLQVKLDRPPTTEEIAKELDIPKEKVEATLAEMENNNIVSIYDSKDGGASDSFQLIDTIQDANSPDPLAELETSDVKRELASALSKLPERERMILALYYHENMTLKEIGEAISISESRVCQLHAQAIMKLRKFLTGRNI